MEHITLTLEINVKMSYLAFIGIPAKVFFAYHSLITKGMGACFWWLVERHVVLDRAPFGDVVPLDGVHKTEACTFKYNLLSKYYLETQDVWLQSICKRVNTQLIRHSR